MYVETKRLKIVEVFDQYIVSHILGDLDILDKIQPNNGSNSCAIPTAMLIFSALDFIGYMLRKNTDGREKIDWSQSTKNIKTAINHSSYFSKKKYRKFTDLVGTYRNGMMHAFYPQEKSSNVYGICKSRSNDLFIVDKIDGRETTSLNVTVLSHDFRKFINRLYAEIKSTRDERLICRMYNSFKEFYQNETPTSSTTTTQTTIAPGSRVKSK